MQIDVAQHGLGRVVGERHVLESHVALDRWQRHRVGSLLHRRVRRQQLVELHDRRLTLLVQVVLLHQLLDRREEQVEVPEECDELADGQAAVAHHVAADEEEHRLADEADPLGEPAVGGDEHRGVVVGVAVVTDDVAVVQHVVPGAVEPGHHADAREALGEVAQHAGDAVAHALVAAVGRLAEPQRQTHEQRHDAEQCHQRQFPVVGEEHHRDDHHDETLQHELRQAVLEQLLERLDVARHAGHDHARLLLGEVVERQALQVSEDPQPQLVHHP